MKGGGKSIAEIVQGHPNVDSIVVGWDLGITAKKVGTAINYIQWHTDLHKDEKDFRPVPIIACAGDTGGVLGMENVEGTDVKLRAIGNGAMADIVARSFDPPKQWIDMG